VSPPGTLRPGLRVMGLPAKRNGAALDAADLSPTAGWGSTQNAAGAARLPQRVSVDIGIGKERVDGGSKRAHHGSFALNEALRRPRPTVLPGNPANAIVATRISRLSVATVVQRLLASSAFLRMILS